MGVCGGGSDPDDFEADIPMLPRPTVPAWLRPYRVLSNGERFRADLARIVCEAPKRVVIDEFTSVVDRQIAKVGALAPVDVYCPPGPTGCAR